MSFRYARHAVNHVVWTLVIKPCALVDVAVRRIGTLSENKRANGITIFCTDQKAISLFKVVLNACSRRCSLWPLGLVSVLLHDEASGFREVHYGVEVFGKSLAYDVMVHIFKRDDFVAEKLSRGNH